MRFIAIFVITLASALAQVRVTVSDTIRNANGSPWSGTLYYSHPAWTCGTVPVPKEDNVPVQVVNGIFSVQLYATDQCGGGASYSVRYQNSRSSALAYWVIPSSPLLTGISSIQQSYMPTPAFQMAITALSMPNGMAGKCLGSIDGVNWIAVACSGAGSGGVWGGITGIMSNQADLQAALDLKVTQAQARALITATLPIVYNGITGIISCPTCGSGSGAITTVFGRTGDVVAQAGDYSAHYVSLTGSYSNPTWINSLPYSKISSPPVIPTTTSQLTNDSGYLQSTGSYVNPAWISSLSVTKLSGITGTANTTTFLRGDWSWQQVSLGSANWGQINGLMSAQADLTAALNAKQGTITTGTQAQYFRGDLSLATFPNVPTLTSQLTNDSGFLQSTGSYANPTWLTSLAWAKISGAPVIPTLTSQLTNDSSFLASTGSYANPTWITSLAYAKLTGTPTIPSNTSQISESGNLYFTNARARGALSATLPLVYDSVNGIFSCPTCITSQYTLPIATSVVLGGVKVGAGLAVDGTGVLSATSGGGNMSVNNGTVDPSGACTAGQSFYLRTDTQELWYCGASGTWQKVLSVVPGSGFTATGQKSAEPIAPAVSNETMWFDQTSLTLYVKDAGGTKSTTIVPRTARVANQFIAYVDGNGVQQPAPIVAGDVPDLSATYSTKAAGGDLSGTLPNPTVKGLNGTLLSSLGGLIYVTNGTGAVRSAINSDLPSHGALHAGNASDPVPAATTTIRGTVTTTTTTTQVVSNDDTRMTNARTPTSHAASHQPGGADPVATSTPTINAIPASDGTGKISGAWINSITGAQIASADKSGNGTKLVTTSATGTSGNCVQIDANGNHIDSGAPCGTGGGGSTTGLYSGSLTFTAIADGACQQQTFTATGLTTGTALALSLPSALDSNLVGTAFASAADTVAVRLCAFGATVTPTAGLTYKVRNLDSLGYLTASAAIDFGGITDGTCAVNTLTLTGAAAGDNVAPGWPSTLESGLIGSMYVSGANTVSIRLCNWSGTASIDPASQTFKAGITR